jgi:hypothetical protein
VDQESRHDGSQAGNSNITSYISIGAERNSKGWNVSAKASSWVTTPAPYVSIKKHGDISERALGGAIAIASVAVEAFEEQLMEGMKQEQIDVFKAAVIKVANGMLERKSDLLQGAASNDPNPEGTGADGVPIETADEPDDDRPAVDSGEESDPHQSGG